jgi:site-specific DNA-methyltransferase (adenine-specific)
MNRIHFKSTTVECSTSQAVFDELHAVYDFTLDPCATVENAKCKKYYTMANDGLSQSWKDERVFMNPPIWQGY